MVEYKNIPAFDGFREKADPIGDKILGSEEMQRQGTIKRMEVREIMGDKRMREVTLNYHQRERAELSVNCYRLTGYGAAIRLRA